MPDGCLAHLPLSNDCSTAVQINVRRSDIRACLVHVDLGGRHLGLDKAHLIVIGQALDISNRQQNNPNAGGSPFDVRPVWSQRTFGTQNFPLPGKRHVIEEANVECGAGALYRIVRDIQNQRVMRVAQAGCQLVQ